MKARLVRGMHEYDEDEFFYCFEERAHIYAPWSVNDNRELINQENILVVPCDGSCTTLRELDADKEKALQQFLANAGTR